MDMRQEGDAMPLGTQQNNDFAQVTITVFDKGIIIKHNKNRANLH